jgi:sugar phosphate isomerase/epimerase
MRSSRRDFIKKAGLGVASCSLPFTLITKVDLMVHNPQRPLRISLAQWSLHKSLFEGRLDHLDFPAKAKSFGIEAVEYVNAFFKDKALDTRYLRSMNDRCDELGVKQLLIMIDGEGGLAEPDDKVRMSAVENHYKWVEAAKFLGCHSIRVNAYGTGTDRESLRSAAVDGLGRLATYAKPEGINIIVENHGGFSSDGAWLASVMKEINMDNCGTLPDFGNFCIRQADDGSCLESYDHYKGVAEMMPYAKAVSAKSYDFDASGNETTIDYRRMLDIVRKSGFEGHIGIEYEGNRLNEDEGIIATKRLLEICFKG